MAILTLISDYNSDDLYTGIIKGKLTESCPGATLVDLKHTVTPFSYIQAAISLKIAYKHFPKGTIHLIMVNTIATETEPCVGVEADGHYFIGVANGVFQLLFEEVNYRIFEIDLQGVAFPPSFPELVVFPKIAAFLLAGGKVEDLGPPLYNLKKIPNFLASYDSHQIEGHVIHIDTYSNAITNINQTKFEQFRRGRNFKIIVRSAHNLIERIDETYSPRKTGNLLALFNAAGLLEIAMYQGRLCEMLDIDAKTNIKILFL